MSDTPRTDTAEQRVLIRYPEGWYSKGQVSVVPADFARELEREVTRWKALADGLLRSAECEAEDKEIRRKLVAPEARLPEDVVTLLSVCRMCDLIYRAHEMYYGLGQTVFGVTITQETNVADLVDAVIDQNEREPQSREPHAAGGSDKC